MDPTLTPGPIPMLDDTLTGMPVSGLVTNGSRTIPASDALTPTATLAKRNVLPYIFECYIYLSI
jgi:hypothetical protein